ncbi:3-coathanger stack domain-containing protein [uncultured Arcticibacterium sp.]|uniref:beta strand repeat-containing protein n=1 Tax=uncultured Arcticibacterium sp. TaxID=2173042 RepID=UPI0030FBBF0C
MNLTFTSTRLFGPFNRAAKIYSSVLNCVAYLGLVTLLFISNSLKAQVPLVSWDVNGIENYGESPLAPVANGNIENIVGFTRGTGVNAGSGGVTGGWGGTNWESTYAGAIADESVINFGFKPKPGFAVSLLSLEPFSYRRSGTGPQDGRLEYTINGGTSFSGITQGPFFFGSSSVGGAAVSPTRTLTGDLDLQETSEEIGFKLIPYNSTSASGSFYIYDVASGSDFSINGRVLGTTETALALDACLDFDGTAKTFEVKGDGLTVADVTITAPASFEISLDGITYAASLTLSPVGGSVSETYFVRLKSGLAPGTYNEKVTVAGGGFSLGANLGVDVNGTVHALPTAFVNAVSPICIGDDFPTVSIDLTGNAPFNLTYSDGTSSTGPITTSDNPYEVLSTADGESFTATGLTDAKGCVALEAGLTGSATVVVNSLPEVSVVASTGSTSGLSGVYNEGESIVLNATIDVGSGAYSWEGPDGFTAGDNNSQTILSSNSSKAGVYTVTVTNGNSCEGTATANVIVYDNILFVDDSGDNSNTGSGSSPLATIQKAVDVSISGGIIQVGAGTYAENIVVDKELDIRGPNYGISPNTGIRDAEAIIVPATSGSDALFTIKASDITIDGFKLDGDNVNLSSGWAGTNGADIDVYEGIVYYDAGNSLVVNGLKVENNILQNIQYFGIDLFGWKNYNNPSTTGHLISNNLFNDLGTYNAGNGYDKWGGAILLYNDNYAHVTDNVMNNVRMGVQTGNFHDANPGDVIYQTIENNNIQTRRLGVFFNLHTGPNVAPMTVSNNTITAIANSGELKWNGMLLSSLSDAAGTVSGNVIDGTGTDAATATVNGIEVWNVKNDAPVAISEGTISNVNTGIFLNNFDGYSTDASNGAHASISDITISPNTSGTGIRLLDSPKSSHVAVEATLGADIIINGGAIGIEVDSASAKVNSPLGNVSFTGQTGDYIKTRVNTNNMDATAASFDGKTGATASKAENFAIEDKITHKIDNAALGLVRVKAAELFVTTNSGNIQRAVDAASVSDIVNVNEGTFNEQVIVNKSLTILGPNDGVSPNTGDRGDEAVLVNSAAGRAFSISNGNTDVTISGFKFDGGSPIHDGNATGNPNTSDVTFSKNLIVNGNAIYAANGTSWADLIITDNKFEDINATATSSGMQVSHTLTTTITDNTFININYAAMVIDATPTVNISGNTVDGTGYQGIQIAGAVGDVTIENNKISNANNVAQAVDRGAIRLYGSDFVGTVLIANNEITGGYNGIAIKDGQNISGKNITISENSITNLTAGNAIYHGGIGALNATCNWFGSTEAATVNIQVTGDVNFLPFGTNGTDDDVNTLGFQPVSGSCDGYGPVIVYEGSTTNVRSSHMTIQGAIDAATANDVVEIGVASHTEGQIIVNKSLTIQGKGSANTTVHSNYNTLTSNHANDASAWIRTTAGTTVNIKNLTLDALGMTSHVAVRFQSDGSVEGVAFNEIKSAPVNGTAIQIVNGNVDIENSVFTNIGRIGAHFRSGVIPAAIISGSFKNNTYTGKGAGNWLDYALDISGGVDPLLVEGNTITNNLGIAESDGSTSAGILVTSYFPLPANSVANNVTIQGNTLSGNYAGVTAGYLAGDISVLKIEGNDIVGNTHGVTTNGPLVNAAKNYWGSPDGPSGSGSGSGNSIADGIDACPFYNGPVATGTLVDCPVLNTNTSESFVSIQAALDDSDTDNGHVITVAAGTYNENIVVNKEVVILGANADTDCSGTRNLESIISVSSGLPFNITADNVVINGFEITAPSSSNAIRVGDASHVDVVFNNIHEIGTTYTGGNIHSIIYTVPSTNNSDINISDNCINDISSTNLTGYSSSAIGILQSTSTGVLTGLNIERNIISNVTVNDGDWPTGKIAYGIQINVGGNSNYLSNTGKVVNASISNNEISNISGFVATGIGLEGNTEDAIVTGNKVSNLTSSKSSDKAGGGYDLNGLKFENNAFVSTVTVENNSFETTSFTNNGTSNRGYGVVNYVPGATATLGCNWFGTAVYNEIEDNGISGKVLSKATANIDFSPYLTDGGDGAGIGFQPTGDCSGSPLVITSAISSPELCESKGSIEFTFTGGTAPFAFSWTGGGSASEVTSPYFITGLDAGAYTVTVSDDNGSSVTATAEVVFLPVYNSTSSQGYANIQDAIDAATAGDVIEVCEGTYNESLIVPIAVSLIGPNAGTSGCDSRGTEATIDGYIKVTSSDVSINGFRLLDGAQAPAGELAAVHIVSALSNVSITNNYVERTGVLDFDVSRGIVNEIGGTTNLTVSNNYFTGWHTGTYLQNADADVTNNCYVLNQVGISSDTPIDVLVDGNDIHNNAFEGIGIGGTVGQMIISNNNITGNLDGVHNYSSTEINAGSNWWGDASGPSDFGPGTGDKVSANITFCPLLNDEVGVGTAVDCRVLNISNGESFVSIQAAINDAETSAGDTLVAEAGTYNENIVVNKEVVILGANADTDCGGTRNLESIISVSSGLPFNITADNVVINGFEITAPSSSNAIRVGDASHVDVVFNNIHEIGTTYTGGNIHSIIYTVPSTNNSDINISDNCINDISSTNLTGYSSSAIGILQSTSTGVLTGLNIERNIISNVTVNDGDWPTGKIAYGIQINVGGNSNYLSNTGKVVNASISNNEISNISGFVATGIGLEGNTEDAIVTGNKVSNLTSSKSSDKAGGGYDLNGLKFENNAFVSTVTVENNSFETTSFTNNGTSNRGYGVVNYVPGATATLGCNWFGTAVYNEIEDNGISGKVLSKATANIDFSPYLTDGGDGAGIGFQPTGDCSGSPLVITSATAGPTVCATKGLINVTFSGGTAPFDFSWTGDGSASDVTSPYSITELDAGVYTVTITDINGSSATATVEVILYPIPEVPTIETDNSELCKGESAVLTGTCSSSSDIFRWTTPGVNEGDGVSALSNTGTLTVQKAGTYSGYCETQNGCTSDMTSMVINEKSNCGSSAFITITPELPAICPGASIDLTATGCTGTITWYADGASPVTGYTATLSPAVTTSYFVSCSSGGSNTVDVKVAEQNLMETGKVTTGMLRVKASETIESTKKIGDANFTPAPNVTYEAGNAIVLMPGFSTEHSTVFKAEIKVCD